MATTENLKSWPGESAAFRAESDSAIWSSREARSDRGWDKRSDQGIVVGAPKGTILSTSGHGGAINDKIGSTSGAQAPHDGREGVTRMRRPRCTVHRTLAL